MIEINNKTRKKISQRIIKETAEKFLKEYKLAKYGVSIAFIGDKKMRELNKIYRQKDKTTDVLSFPGEGNFLGEILINPEKIKKQAKENKKTFLAELIFILIHGLLHLAGYTDETEKGRLEMIKRGEEFIKKRIYN